MQKVHEKHNKKATRNKISLKSGENHLRFFVLSAFGTNKLPSGISCSAISRLMGFKAYDSLL